MTTLILEPPAALMNANERPHWRAKSLLTKAWREAAQAAATRERCGYWTVPARVIVHIRWPNNIKRDPGNWYPTAKAIVDGLVDAGVFVDDDSNYVIGPDLRREYPNGPLRVTITIQEQP